MKLPNRKDYILFRAFNFVSAPKEIGKCWQMTVKRKHKHVNKVIHASNNYSVD